MTTSRKYNSFITLRRVRDRFTANQVVRCNGIHIHAIDISPIQAIAEKHLNANTFNRITCSCKRNTAQIRKYKTKLKTCIFELVDVSVNHLGASNKQAR